MPVIRRDMLAEGGIIVDGLLELPQPEGPGFKATLEASSAGSRQEVQYTRQEVLLFWDSLASGLVIIALVLTFLQVKDLISFPDSGFFLAAVLTLAALAVFILAYRLILGNLRRYRYIYAIEQFKRYFADEQWVAIGEDVFEDPDDPYFKELRDQCVYNGFGVIVVDLDRHVQVHITPSPVDLFGQKRKKVRFLSLEELGRRLKDSAYQSYWKKFLSAFPWNKERQDLQNLLRFQRVYVHQIVISLFALMIIGTVFYRETLKAPFRFVNERQYARQMAREAESLEKEPQYYLVDSPFIAAFRRDVSPYLDMDAVRLPVESQTNEQHSGMIVYLGGDRFFAYDCQRMFQGNAPRFVIEAGRYDDLPGLKAAIVNFQRNGFDAMGIWAGCFSPQADHYTIVMQQFFFSREEAELQLPAVEALFDRQNLTATPVVRALY